jgi:hypothetical protein
MPLSNTCQRFCSSQARQDRPAIPLRSAPLLYAASWLRGNFLCLAGIATETTSVWKSALPASAKALSYEYAGAPDRGPWCGSYPKTWGRRATLAA